MTINMAGFSEMLESLMNLRDRQVYGSNEHSCLENAIKALGGNLNHAKEMTADEAWNRAVRYPKLDHWRQIAAAIEAVENTGDWSNYDSYWLTIEQAKGRVDFQARSDSEKSEMRKGSYSSTRKHIDGRIINEKDETVGRWDDNIGGIRQYTITKNLPMVLEKHQDGFLQWLEIEREMAIKINGQAHPVVKHDVFGKIIRLVKDGEKTDRSALKQQYENYLAFLKGENPQLQPDDSIESPDPRNEEIEVKRERKEMTSKAIEDIVGLSIINRASSYHAANFHKPNRGVNWLRVLIAFDKVWDGSRGRFVGGRAFNVETGERIDWADIEDTNPVKEALTLTPMTAKEAWENTERWDGWKPFAEALDKLEKADAVGKVLDVEAEETKYDQKEYVRKEKDEIKAAIDNNDWDEVIRWANHMKGHK